MATATTTEPATKACNLCYEEKPIGEFRRQGSSRADRRTDCNDCHALRMRKFRAKRRDKMLQRELARITKAREAGKAIEIVTQLVARFGGPQQFAAAYKQNYDAAVDAGRTFTAFRMQLAVMRIDLAAKEIEAERSKEIKDMSREEIEAELERIFRRSLKKWTERKEHPVEAV